MFNSGDQLMFQCQSRQFQIQRNNYNTNDSGSNFHELAPNCPRCASPNTKFCYYNNYSLSQPRYFCKGCRRYWTKGGSLRNVPVGGGCRKSRRANSKSRVQSVYSQRSDGDRASSQESPNNGGGSDIDLAVVFAKFLNEDNSSSSTVVSEGNVDQIDQFGINNVSNSPTFDSYQSNQSGTIQDSDFFDRLPDQVLENGFGIQNFGGYEDQMGLWIDDGSWETGLMQFDQHHQDLDYGFTNLLDDQIKISANLMNQDNWSSFDTSGFNYS